MNTNTAPVVTVQQIDEDGASWHRRTSHKVRNGIVAGLAFLAALIVTTPAHAAAPGLLNGAETSFFSSISGFLTGNLLPLVFVLAAVVIGATMLIRYGRKAVSS